MGDLRAWASFFRDEENRRTAGSADEARGVRIPLGDWKERLDAAQARRRHYLETDDPRAYLGAPRHIRPRLGPPSPIQMQALGGSATLVRWHTAAERFEQTLERCWPNDPERRERLKAQVGKLVQTTGLGLEQAIERVLWAAHQQDAASSANDLRDRLVEGLVPVVRTMESAMRQLSVAFMSSGSALAEFLATFERSQRRAELRRQPRQPAPWRYKSGRRVVH